MTTMPPRFSLATAALCALVPLTSLAMPRFAARTGMTCSACHTNPTGAGMRSAFGASVYGTRFLPIPLDEAPRTDRWLNPQPTAALGLGADIRALYMTVLPGENDAPEEGQLEAQHTFFLMQADLYLRAEVAEWATLLHDQGVYGAFESMAILRFGGFIVKAGQFVPPYGWKLANHTAWTRERLGFGATGREVGLELGAEYGPFTAHVAFVNGAAEDIFDDNAAKGISGRLEVRLGRRSVRARLGASAYWNISGEDADDGDTRREDLRVGGTYAFFVGRLGVLGEVDFRRIDDRGADVPIVGSLVGYHELSFLAWQGIDLRVTWEHLDPDVEVADDLLQRLGVGIEVMPISGVEVQLLARYVLGDSRLAESGLFDVSATLHLFF